MRQQGARPHPPIFAFPVQLRLTLGALPPIKVSSVYSGDEGLASHKELLLGPRPPAAAATPPALSPYCYCCRCCVVYVAAAVASSIFLELLPLFLFLLASLPLLLGPGRLLPPLLSLLLLLLLPLLRCLYCYCCRFIRIFLVLLLILLPLLYSPLLLETQVECCMPSPASAAFAAAFFMLLLRLLHQYSWSFCRWLCSCWRISCCTLASAGCSCCWVVYIAATVASSIILVFLQLVLLLLAMYVSPVAPVSLSLVLLPSTSSEVSLQFLVEGCVLRILFHTFLFALPLPRLPRRPWEGKGERPRRPSLCPGASR